MKNKRIAKRDEHTIILDYLRAMPPVLRGLALLLLAVWYLILGMGEANKAKYISVMFILGITLTLAILFCTTAAAYINEVFTTLQESFPPQY